MNLFEIILIINCAFLLGYLLIVYKLYKSLNNLNYRAEHNQPNISIIVSLHNEEKNVNQLVDCLVKQDYPKEQFEIILVNDRSTDNTQQLLETAEKLYANIKIVTIDKLQEGFAPKKYAIDFAINQSRGEIVLLSDADGRPAAGWVKKMLSYFSDDAGLVIGNAPYFADTLMQKYLAMEYFSHSTIAAATAGLGYPLTCVGTNMAYRKKVYSEIDGFGEFKNVHTGDDDLFLQRVRDKTKWKIRYATAKESQIQNAAPTSLKQFINQRMRYASKGFKYPMKVTISLAAYYLFNVTLFLLAILSLLNNALFIPFLIILLIKGLADFCLMKKSSNVLNTKIHFILFPIMNILHIPYVIFFGLMGNLKKYEWAGINRQNL